MNHVGRALLMLVAFLSFSVAPSLAEDITQLTKSDRDAPLRVSKVTAAQLPQQDALRVCFAFQNLAVKGVSSARFHIAVLDQFNSEAIRKDVVFNSGSTLRSGGVSNPPDATATNVADTNDGTISCYLLSKADATVSNFNGVQPSAFQITVRNVRFDDGSTWATGQTFPRAYNADGTRFAPAFPTTWSTNPENTAPFMVIGAGIHATTFGDPMREQCVTFRNLSDKVASFVKFSFTFTDENGSPLPDRAFTNHVDGTFTPPVLVENKCTTNTLPPLDQIRRMRFEKISVAEVHYIDGTVWTPGQPFTKRFNAVDGTPYTGSQPFQVPTPIPAPTAAPTSAPTAPPTPAPTAAPTAAPTPAPTPTGGTVIDVPTGGGTYGEIAWVPGTFNIHGAVADQSSYDDARFGALDKCRAAAGSRKESCKAVIGTKNPALKAGSARCAAFAFDGSKAALGYGTTRDEAMKNAIDTLEGEGGSLSNNHWIERICNSQ